MVLEISKMRITFSKTKSYRDDNGKNTSKIFKKLGTMADVLPEHDNDREQVIAWAREQAQPICRRNTGDRCMMVSTRYVQPWKTM